MTDDELRLNLESLHASVHELYEATQRHDSQIEQLTAAGKQDAENIRSLARIATDALDSIQRLEHIASLHQQRLDDLQGETE